VTVPANIVAEAASAAGAVVTFSASATDLIAGALTPTCSPASGATFPLGVTTVNCSASDGTNTGTASFTVTVQDTVDPTITISASPMLLWPPDGSQVTVTVSGITNDAGVVDINWRVDDEYNQVEPSGSTTAVNGKFSFPIVLVRDRRGNDKNGRHYTILVTARDAAGNETKAAPLVVNVHDQSGG